MAYIGISEDQVFRIRGLLSLLFTFIILALWWFFWCPISFGTPCNNISSLVDWGTHLKDFKVKSFIIFRRIPVNNKKSLKPPLHPGRLTWNLQITHLERKMIFQTSMIMFHVNLPGCNHNSSWTTGHPWRVPPSNLGHQNWKFWGGKQHQAEKDLPETKLPPLKSNCWLDSL